ncbi:MAG TPA: HYR domain-containing protein [Acidimicrobiales bacterium]|nr:HYR domain-containing protein [Acidimicrobiales bacterium]
MAFIAAASVIGTGTAFAAVASPGPASSLSSGCQLASLIGSSKNVPSASATNYMFNAGEQLVVAFSKGAQGATTGTLSIGIAAATSGVATVSGPVPGSASYIFQSSGTYGVKASVNGTAVMAFSCSLTDTDLALSGVPANITTNATSPAGAVVAFTPPTAVDEDTPLPAVTCDHAPGGTFPIGTTTVTCSASDVDDTPSTVSASFTVTVTDSDLALVGVPADITVAATGSSGAVVTFTPPAAADEDTPLPAVTCDHASGSTFPVGTTTVTCAANDADDTPSTATASFHVTVTDSDLALNGAPADITVTASGPAGAVVTFTPPSASDEDTPLPAVTCDHASGDTFPIGVTKVTCTVTDTDDSPSSASVSFNVTVNAPPDTDLGLTAAPADITVSSGPNGTAVTYTPPTAVDEDTPLPPVTCDHPSGSVFPVGVTKVTCTVTDSDDSPSSASVSFTVTVNDPPQGVTAQLAQLAAAVKGDKSLHEKVERAESDLGRHDIKGACRELDSFIDAVGEEHHHGMTKAGAAALIAGAQRIEAALGCPKPGTHHGKGDDDSGAHSSTGKPATGGDHDRNGAHPSSK